jgi:ankyrin repeat protein
VSFLIAHGADVNLKSNGLRTALYYAKRKEFAEIVRVLIENGAI